ncbi:MAG: aroma-sacti cluster domain-containing protein [Gaiellaceae bacterium]
MPENGSDNEQRLRAKGLIMEGDLPEPYKWAVEGLTKQEVNTLIAIKKRLDGADAWEGLPPVQVGQQPPFTTFMIF